MSDSIKHECGVAVIRLLKPLSYYKEKYGTAFYALNKLYLLMEKQHNRGQDGAGVGVVKLHMKQGQRFMARERSNSPQAISDIFFKIFDQAHQLQKSNPELAEDPEWLKKNFSFMGEMMMGHLRYGTHGKNDLDTCHPFIANDSSSTRGLIMCGNFNLTNIEDLGWKEEDKDIRPDTAVALDQVGMYLENEINRVYAQLKGSADTDLEMKKIIGDHINFVPVLREAAATFDGGYHLAGLSSVGTAFVMRDPNGIRPSFYFKNDEIVVAASERPAIMTAFHVPLEEIHELKPGHALIIDKQGNAEEHQLLPAREKTSCSFERIYFSRGSDPDIYEERKNLGRLLAPAVLDEVDHDWKNTVFSFIPNTAEVAFYGLIKAAEDRLNDFKIEQIQQQKNHLTDEVLHQILRLRPRIEKIAIKDVKARTFITQDSARNEMVEHVYDITYGSIRRGLDTIVVIDDSIVRGTTLKKSIVKMLDRLGPKKIVIVSSAPQIRYPDCYGIDMSKMGDFIAFRSMMELIELRGKEHLVEEVYDACLRQEHLPAGSIKNEVKRLYAEFTDEEIADQMSAYIREPGVNAEVKIIFQKIEDLHKACPQHKGDWYFSGNYPTAGGNKVVNRAFLNYMQGVNKRAY